jgi:hypothetical protein
LQNRADHLFFISSRRGDLPIGEETLNLAFQRLQIGNSLFNLLQLVLQVLANFWARLLPSVVDVQDVANFLQAQAQALAAADKSQTNQNRRVEQPIAGLRPFHRWLQQAYRFVVAHRAYRQAGC